MIEFLCRMHQEQKALLVVSWLTYHYSTVWLWRYHGGNRRWGVQRVARRQIQWIRPSTSKLSNSVLTTCCSPTPTRLSPDSTRPSSPSPARLSLGDISNMLARRHEEENCKQIDDLQRWIAKYERNGHSAYMGPQHQPYQVQGPPHPISWAMSPPPFRTFFPSPFGYILIAWLQLHSRHPGQ